jgi:hypothetical protein
VGFDHAPNARGDAFEHMFLSSDFAMMRTSGEYIALPAERQWKSILISVARPFRPAGVGDCDVPT